MAARRAVAVIPAIRSTRSRGRCCRRSTDARYLLGTDRNGRDIAAGIAHGARVSLMIGVTAAAGAILIGTVIGALAGFYRGWIDDVLMRLTDAAQTVPNFLLALALVAVLGPATWSVVMAIALVSWPGTARIVRAEFLSLREREFVLACRTMGMGDGRLIFGQMLPNVASSIVVLATVVVSVAILVEVRAQLSRPRRSEHASAGAA